MVIKNCPGIFLIIDYNTTRFFVGYSSENMADIVGRNVYQIEKMTHNSTQLYLAFHHKHELDYLTVIEFEKGTPRKDIINKRNQIINALETVNPVFGFNTYSSKPSPVRHGIKGIYVIIVIHPKTKKRKFYIGKGASDVRSRLKKHEEALKKGTHEIKELQNDFNTGYKFCFKLLLTFTLKEITDQQLQELETQLIYIFRSHLKEYGYNTNAKGVFSHCNRVF